MFVYRRREGFMPIGMNVHTIEHTNLHTKNHTNELNEDFPSAGFIAAFSFQ